MTLFLAFQRSDCCLQVSGAAAWVATAAGLPVTADGVAADWPHAANDPSVAEMVIEAMSFMMY
jgi:hypothetical protein